VYRPPPVPEGEVRAGMLTGKPPSQDLTPFLVRSILKVSVCFLTGSLRA